MRQNQSPPQKVLFVDKVLQEIIEGLVAIATEYNRGIKKCVTLEVERLRNKISKWIKPDEYGK